MKKHGKRFKNLVAAYDSEAMFATNEAVALVKKNANAKFNETIEIHIKLGVDPKKSDQNVRGTVNLPHGTGRVVRVIAFARGDAARAHQARPRERGPAEQGELDKRVRPPGLGAQKRGQRHHGERGQRRRARSPPAPVGCLDDGEGEGGQQDGDQGLAGRVGTAGA